ncbi:MAG: FG-GAP repeat protein, partial [Myxococcota bacterium]|nr:FG-GAP repeat protein [Myxococcota bacterium]
MLLSAGALACTADPAVGLEGGDGPAHVVLDRVMPAAFREPGARYAALATRDGWRFGRTGLEATIGAGEAAALRIRTGELALDVGVVGVERGGEHVALGAPRVDVDGARARVMRGDVVEELFVHGAPGIEHAIIVERAPAGEGPLEIVVALAGAPHVEVGERGATVLDAREREALSYEGLRAWDAQGVELPAHMARDARGVRLVIDDRDAQLPIVIDPLIALPRAVLVASDAAIDDELGTSVAVEGDLAVAGAPERAGGGAAYVFERTATGWIERATLVPPMVSPGDDAGESVALSGDTIVIGSPRDNDPVYSAAGAVDVFRRVAAGWTHEARIANPDATVSNELFGRSVAIVGDVMVVGAPGDRTGGTFGAGGAYVYRRTGTVWASEGTLLWSRLSSNDNFGFSVATDGTRIAVGAPYENGMILEGGVVRYEDVGAVFVFARAGDAWIEEARLAATTERSFEYLGESVAIDGTRVIAGATGADDAEAPIDRRGAAYVFVRSGAAWSEEERLLPSASDWVRFATFGASVALEGTLAAIGAPGARTTGVGYVFERGATGWTPTTTFAGDPTTTRELGAAMAIDGATWLVGAPRESGDRGAAHVLELVVTGSIGQPCVAATDCDSGFCADGVCCGEACGGGPT